MTTATQNAFANLNLSFEGTAGYGDWDDWSDEKLTKAELRYQAKVIGRQMHSAKHAESVVLSRIDREFAELTAERNSR